MNRSLTAASMAALFGCFCSEAAALTLGIDTRCPFATEICKTTEPKLEHSGHEHDVACHHWQEIAD